MRYDQRLFELYRVGGMVIPHRDTATPTASPLVPELINSVLSAEPVYGRIRRQRPRCRSTAAVALPMAAAPYFILDPRGDIAFGQDAVPVGKLIPQPLAERSHADRRCAGYQHRNHIRDDRVGTDGPHSAALGLGKVAHARFGDYGTRPPPSTIL